MDERQIPKFAYQYFPTGRRKVIPPRNSRTGQENHEDGTSLAGLYFVPADDGDDGDKKSKCKTLAPTNKVILLPFNRRYRIKAYVKPTTYSKKT